MKLISNDLKYHGKHLEPIVGTNLWKVILNIPDTQKHIEFGVSFKFDSSWKLGTVKLYEQNKELRTRLSLFSVESPLIIQLVLDENREEEYCSHCLFILRSARNLKELECMAQIKALEEMSQGLYPRQKEGILKKTIQTIQKGLQIQGANSAGFLCFLSQMNIPTLKLQKMMPMDLANQVFQECLSTSWTPNSIKNLFETIENVYKTAFRENANFLSYCNFMYHIFGPKTSRNMLLKWKRENYKRTLLPYNPENSRQTLKSLVEKVFLSFDENCDISEEIDFLQTLQESLTIELQIELVKDLDLRKISPLDMQLAILYSFYEKNMNEFSRKGDIVSIICQWNRISSCVFLSADKLHERTKKCLIASFDKTSDTQLKDACRLLQELCVNGTLFNDAVSQLQMMQRMATSLNESFHSLLPACLNEWTLQDISTADLETIVLTWFSLALKHHCKRKSKREKTSTSLLKLYSYVSKISMHPLLRSESDLKRNLDRKAFDYLKEFEITDIISFVPEMAKLETGPTENMFRDHIRELFTQGLQNEDLKKQTLFQHIGTKEVNSQ